MRRQTYGPGPNTTNGMCECGCGQAAPIAKTADLSRGIIKGKPNRYIAGHNNQRRADVKSRYRMMRASGTSRLSHIVIVENVLGKPLPAGAEVHHVDGDGTNNTHSNLVVCPNRAYHQLLHVRQRIVAIGGDPNTQKICGRCHRPRPLTEFSPSKVNNGNRQGSRCRDCDREYARLRRAA